METKRTASRFRLYDRDIVITEDGKLFNGSKLQDTSKGAVLATRAWKAESTQVRIGDVVIGGQKMVVIAGPCALWKARARWKRWQQG